MATANLGMSEPYDAIIIGSGAGGSAVAYKLVKAGSRVLLLEKGDYLPRDGSTLDVEQVFRQGRFRNQQAWVDRCKRALVPEEYYNVGGKTKWYGAALLRFSPHEFEADIPHQCLPWPISYDDLATWYDEAEKLLGVRTFAHEPDLQRMIKRITAAPSDWRQESLPLGLHPEILEDEHEAKHFDGFASVANFKADAERDFLKEVLSSPGCALQTDCEVSALIHAEGNPATLIGVDCTNGQRYHAPQIILAAGAMSSPRLLQRYLNESGLAEPLPSAALVGAHFKMHINSALLSFSPFKRHDMLRKTAIFFNHRFPHSSVQPLGWLDGEILATQLPGAVPQFMADFLGARAYGFFITTEDGSDARNRISESAEGEACMDYDLARLTPGWAEHQAVIRAFQTTLLRNGLLSASRYMGNAGTAHALGSLVMGDDAAHSVVDRHGCVHGMRNLFVADGSVLPRSSRVNPALTIYAWGLRLGDFLARQGEV